MQHFRAAEQGPARFELLLRVCAAELRELWRLQRIRAAEHGAAALEDLKRIWKPRYCAAEPGTANIVHCTRGYAAEAENLRRTHRVRAAELEALGENYSVSMTKAVSCDPVSEADQDRGSQANEADQAEEVSAGSSSYVLVPGLGGNGRLAELGKELKANEPVPELGEDKANQADGVLLKMRRWPSAKISWLKPFPLSTRELPRTRREKKELIC